MLKPLCKKRAFETPRERGFGRRPFFIVAWGDALGRRVQPSYCLAEGHIHERGHARDLR